MMIPKRQLLTLIFACLCFKKSLLIKNMTIERKKGILRAREIFWQSWLNKNKPFSLLSAWRKESVVSHESVKL